MAGNTTTAMTTVANTVPKSRLPDLMIAEQPHSSTNESRESTITRPRMGSATGLVSGEKK